MVVEENGCVGTGEGVEGGLKREIEWKKCGGGTLVHFVLSSSAKQFIFIFSPVSKGKKVNRNRVELY